MRRVLIALGAVLAVLLGGTVPARAQSGADLVPACMAAGANARACRGIGHLENLFAGLCRDATSNNDACATIDGTVIDEAAVTRQTHSWLNHALGLQRGLDDNLPLQEELWSHTHNSFDADVYPPTFYGIDRNQIYSITDQLRMGIRAIEIDVHWYYSPFGDPANNFQTVVVCHGGISQIPIPNNHIGCGVNDPIFTTRLQELHAWMKKNPNEIVMLYLENTLDADKTAHNVAAQMISKELGPLVYKPTTKSCADLPMDTSRRAIRMSGKRVIITGNCGPSGSAWNNWVFQRGPRWIESGLSYDEPYPAYPACKAVRAKEHYDRNWIRHHGDETGLADAYNGGGTTTVADARNMVNCGVNMIGYDNLKAFDPRLEAVVWSWERNEPNHAHGSCAHERVNGRFYSGHCAERRVFACKTPDGRWAVIGPAGSWDKGAARCRSAGWSFAVPRTGYQNSQLRDVKGRADVWLNYRLS